MILISRCTRRLLQVGNSSITYLGGTSPPQAFICIGNGWLCGQRKYDLGDMVVLQTDDYNKVISSEIGEMSQGSLTMNRRQHPNLRQSALLLTTTRHKANGVKGVWSVQAPVFHLIIELAQGLRCRRR